MAYGGKRGSTARSKIERFIDDHVRLVAAVSTMLVIVIAWLVADLMINGSPFKGKNTDSEKRMPIGYVNSLSEKTGALSWKDFSDFSYQTVSRDEYDEGTYEMRQYAVEGDKLSVTVAGFTDGSMYTGYVEYATVNYIKDFDFEFSLLEDDDFLSYLEEYGILPEKGKG